jgi:integrase
MATFVKTGAGNWKAIIRRLGWPTSTKTFRTKRDAEDWARRTEEEMVRGVYIRRTEQERTTVAEALDRYEREVVPLKKPSTQSREGSRIREVRAFFGSYSLAAVTPQLVAKFRDMRLAQGKANNTVRLELALLGHLFTVAIKEWHTGLPYNPVANVRKPSPGPGRDRRLCGEEQTQLMAVIAEHSNPMLRWIVTLAIETGMRRSEILGLERGNVDLERRVVRLSNTKNNSARTVPLTIKATQLLREALANPIRPLDTRLVFFGEPGRDGVRRPYEFLKKWQTVRRQLGLSDLRFHDLRHEAVSRLVELGLSDQEVASISGHKSMQMLRRYTHLRAEDLVAKLDRLKA